jgi:parallel beta-helix repeat protein
LATRNTISSGHGTSSVAITSDFLTITSNTLGGNGLGIGLGDSVFNTISENDISGNGTGIRIVNALNESTGMVSHNIVNGNAGPGVEIGGIVTVQNNVVNGNGRYGIFVPVPLNGVEVTNNTSLANGMNDLFDAVPGCSGNV